MPRNNIPDYENTERWKKNSDDWVNTMTESKKNKELYQQYIDCLLYTSPSPRDLH